MVQRGDSRHVPGNRNRAAQLIDHGNSLPLMKCPIGAAALPEGGYQEKERKAEGETLHGSTQKKSLCALMPEAAQAPGRKGSSIAIEAKTGNAY